MLCEGEGEVGKCFGSRCYGFLCCGFTSREAVAAEIFFRVRYIWFSMDFSANCKLLDANNHIVRRKFTLSVAQRLF